MVRVLRPPKMVLHRDRMAAHMRSWQWLWPVWGLSLWGVLQLSNAPVLSSHSVCGIWGCGPPTNALLACHLGWLVFLLPVLPLTLSFGQRFPKTSAAVVSSFAVLGVLGLLAVGLHDLIFWYPAASEAARGYFMRRWAFSTITQTDVPMLELLAVGIAGIGIKRFQQ